MSKTGTFLQFTRAWGGEPGFAVCCPVCEIDYVHIGSVTVNQGGSALVVKGMEAMVEYQPTNARGTFLDIPMWCEGGHTFTLHLQFHKGNTYLTAHSFGTYAEHECPDSLWRD